jgi:hypothetical protein
MRPVQFLLVPLLLLSACTTTALWEKAGTEQAAMNLDLGKCRHEALQEATRAFVAQRTYAFYDMPYMPGSIPDVSWRLRRAVESEQAHAEKALAAGCMRRKGYQPTQL